MIVRLWDWWSNDCELWDWWSNDCAMPMIDWLIKILWFLHHVRGHFLNLINYVILRRPWRSSNSKNNRMINWLWEIIQSMIGCCESINSIKTVAALDWDNTIICKPPTSQLLLWENITAGKWRPNLEQCKDKEISFSVFFFITFLLLTCLTIIFLLKDPLVCQAMEQARPLPEPAGMTPMGTWEETSQSSLSNSPL